MMHDEGVKRGTPMITFNDVRELATEYGFNAEAMRQDYVNNRVTLDELWTRLNEEIAADD